jgi:hypothetical protein
MKTRISATRKIQMATSIDDFVMAGVIYVAPAEFAK